MNKYGRFIFLLILICSLNACLSGRKNENNLSAADLRYLGKLGILEEGEKIAMFESNGGFKKSGNFITDRRIASYWIDGRKNEINSAEYPEIDSIKTVDRTGAWTYSSYLEIYYSGGKMFEVYVDADSLRTWDFFNRGITNWKKSREY